MFGNASLCYRSDFHFDVRSLQERNRRDRSSGCERSQRVMSQGGDTILRRQIDLAHHETKLKIMEDILNESGRLVRTWILG